MTATIPNGLAIEKINADAPDGNSILAMADRLLFPKAMAAPANPFACHLSGSQLTCNASTLFVGTYHLFATSKINNNFTGTLTLTAHITSATPDPNPNDTTATDTISDVLSRGGLVNTGANIFRITGAALVLLVGGVLVWNFRRRKPAADV